MLSSGLGSAASQAAPQEALQLKLEVEAESQSTGCRLQTTARSTSTSSQVSLSDYCEFLNAVAPSDPLEFYDEKMDCIMRSGTPGHYTYIDQSSIVHHGDCSKTVTASTSTLNLNSCKAAIDPALQSNIIFYSVNTLAKELTQKNGGGGFGMTLWETLEGITLGMVTVLGGEEGLAVEESGRETDQAEVARRSSD